jgi:hypothetical protein
MLEQASGFLALALFAAGLALWPYLVEAIARRQRRR